jgi:hypothetical protein
VNIHLQGVVDIADTVRLYEGVLLARADKLGEGGQKTLDTDPSHVYKLAGDQGYAGWRAKRLDQTTQSERMED